jgi:hypothetical protein
VKCYIWSTTVYGAETGHFGTQATNIWKIFKCGAGEGRRKSVGPIVWEIKYYISQKEMNILHKQKRNANWVGHNLRKELLSKTCYWKKKLEGRREISWRRGRRRKQLLDDLKETRGYWKLKAEALDRTVENSLWNSLRTCRKTDYT